MFSPSHLDPTAANWPYSHFDGGDHHHNNNVTYMCQALQVNLFNPHIPNDISIILVLQRKAFKSYSKSHSYKVSES